MCGGTVLAGRGLQQGRKGLSLCGAGAILQPPRGCEVKDSREVGAGVLQHLALGMLGVLVGAGGCTGYSVESPSNEKWELEFTACRMHI